MEEQATIEKFVSKSLRYAQKMKNILNFHMSPIILDANQEAEDCRAGQSRVLSDLSNVESEFVHEVSIKRIWKVCYG
jgi:Icc-related predicted phosphoesterase